jgi:hypothetical protein
VVTIAKLIPKVFEKLCDKKTEDQTNSLLLSILFNSLLFNEEKNVLIRRNTLPIKECRRTHVSAGSNMNHDTVYVCILFIYFVVNFDS